MIRAIRSAFYRFFSTGLFSKTVIFSIVIAIIASVYVCTQVLFLFPFRRPRYLDNRFLIYSFQVLLFVIPFATAVFSIMFTGNDITFRAINNKIATGVSRLQIYFADLIVTVVAQLITLVLSLAFIYLTGRFLPVKSMVSINRNLTGLAVLLLIVSVAFAAFFVLLQYFFSNKLYSLIVSLLILPCLMIGTEVIRAELNEPYRFVFIEETTGETTWELNPKYIGGTSRKIITAIYDSSPFGEYVIEGEHITQIETAAGIIFAVSTAAGLATISKKEYS